MEPHSAEKRQRSEHALPPNQIRHEDGCLVVTPMEKTLHLPSGKCTKKMVATLLPYIHRSDCVTIIPLLISCIDKRKG